LEAHNRCIAVVGTVLVECIAAIKTSRLKSLAISAVEVALQRSNQPLAGSASEAVLHALQEAGVDITTAGSLEEDPTPLVAALQPCFFGAAQVLLNAGADVNGLSRDGMKWPLCAAALALSDEGMAWLLERGASLTLANSCGRTIAHKLAAAAGTDEFFLLWLRRVSLRSQACWRREITRVRHLSLSL
jgi:hypothetical protein